MVLRVDVRTCVFTICLVLCQVLDDIVYAYFFFFKQKTAYEMRISDWSSDVCSSDLCGSADLAYATGLRAGKRYVLFNGALECSLIVCDPIARPRAAATPDATPTLSEDRERVV